MDKITEDYLSIVEYMIRQFQDEEMDEDRIKSQLYQAYQLGFQAGAKGAPYDPLVGVKS